MISNQPFGSLPAMQSANEALATILDDGGATLPSRDPVDLRILRSVRDGTGRIIEKETDLPENQRWPEYRSLPAPADADKDGLPDAWQQQFGVTGAMAISAGGYANIEHYASNTDPTGKGRIIVHVQTTVSRATATEPGEWKIVRHGDLDQPLTVQCELSDRGKTAVTIPAGQSSATLASNSATTGSVIVLKLLPDGAYATGCPAQALVVMK